VTAKLTAVVPACFIFVDECLSVALERSQGAIAPLQLVRVVVRASVQACDAVCEGLRAARSVRAADLAQELGRVVSAASQLLCNVKPGVASAWRSSCSEYGSK
jgi:hypothetical protein